MEEVAHGSTYVNEEPVTVQENTEEEPVIVYPSDPDAPYRMIPVSLETVKETGIVLLGSFLQTMYSYWEHATTSAYTLIDHLFTPIDILLYTMTYYTGQLGMKYLSNTLGWSYAKLSSDFSKLLFSIEEWGKVEEDAGIYLFNQVSSVDEHLVIRTMPTSAYKIWSNRDQFMYPVPEEMFIHTREEAVECLENGIKVAICVPIQDVEKVTGVLELARETKQNIQLVAINGAEHWFPYHKNLVGYVTPKENIIYVKYGKVLNVAQVCNDIESKEDCDLQSFARACKSFYSEQPRSVTIVTREKSVYSMIENKTWTFFYLLFMVTVPVSFLTTLIGYVVLRNHRYYNNCYPHPLTVIILGLPFSKW